MFKTSRLNVILAAATAAWLAGCTVDTLVVIRQPAVAGHGETFVVGAVDFIWDMDSASKAPDSVRRDSVHVGVGLPAGWEVISAKACPAPHFRPLKASINRLDTNLRNQLIADTLAACESRAFALGPDSGVRVMLKGRTFRGVPASPETLGKPDSVVVDKVPHWFGFGGRIDVFVPAGQPADTIASDQAVKAIPVYLYLTLKAPPQDTGARIIYYSKTGSLDTNAFKTSTNRDRGSMVYRPIRLTPPTVARPRPASPAQGFSVLRSPEGSLHISLPAPSGSWRGLELRSSTGARLRSWPAAALSSGQILWDGADAAGRALPAGRYLLFLSGANRPAAKPFILLP